MSATTHFAPFVPMANVIPEGEHGNARIEHFTVETHARMFAHPDEYVHPGKYARLYIGNTLWMSDTGHEQRTNVGAVRAAHGNVLIGGLGIGLIVLPILRIPTVNSVLVVERSEDVIAFVETPLRKAAGVDANKLSIVCADVTDWRPERGQRFDLIYFDIWAEQSTDDVEDMKRLHARFRSRLAKGGKVTSWQYDRLKYLKRCGRWR